MSGGATFSGIGVTGAATFYGTISTMTPIAFLYDTIPALNSNQAGYLMNGTASFSFTTNNTFKQSAPLFLLPVGVWIVSCNYFLTLSQTATTSIFTNIAYEFAINTTVFQTNTSFVQINNSTTVQTGTTISFGGCRVFQNPTQINYYLSSQVQSGQSVSNYTVGATVCAARVA